MQQKSIVFVKKSQENDEWIKIRLKIIRETIDKRE